MTWLKKIFTARLWLVLAISFILLIQIPIFLKDTHHLAYNPEPSPDVLFYMIGADNLSRGEGYGLHYYNSKMDIPTPPLYVLYLTVWRLIMPNSPIFFVAGNIFLQIATIYLLYKIGGEFVKRTGQKWVVPAILGLYLSFASVSWYVSLAMIENLGLLIMAAILAVLVLMKNDWKQWLMLVFLALILLLTKYTFAPLAMVLFLIVLIKLIQNKHWKLITVLLLIAVLMATGIWFLFPNIKDVIFSSNGALSFDFIVPNLQKLWLVLSGQSEWILWRNIPFGTGLIWLATVILTIVNWRNKKIQPLNIFSGFLLLSLLPLQLVFYVFDVRYLLQFVPIVSVLIISNFAVLMARVKTSKLRLVLFLALVLIFIAQFINQMVLWRDLYRANILHSEVAWHYVAVQSFDKFFMEQGGNNVYLATFLSPYAGQYMSAADNYRFLPIAGEWLVINNGESNYGADLDNDRLLNDRWNYYNEMLINGAQLYVSNYGTGRDQPGYVATLEELQDYFHAQLVQEGCLGGCNLYKLYVH